jgi:hypothetical protein
MANLVTTDSVRAVLGVSAQELPDSVLTNSIYSVRLSEDLRDLNSQMVSDFITISALASPTPDQTRFIDLLQTYAAYNVARQCLVSLPMFAPLTIKDEKAELTRNVNSYAQLKTDVGEVLSIMRTRLLTAYTAVNSSALAPTVTDRVFGLAVGLGTDPVTGS